jgi:hypothetical protein
MNETPLLRQLLVCEKIVVEKDTGYVSLINCHNQRYCDRFPTRPLVFGIFGVMTNGSGEIPMKLTITRLDTFAVFYERHFMRRFKNRLHTSNLIAPSVNGLIFRVEGAYQFDLWAGDEPIGMTSLRLLRR